MAAIPYEPAIDGLRAVAVLAVCVYHLNPTWLPGGFVGVDIFFVISGFLITRIITAEVEKGTFSLAAFYRRRVARIAPALILVAWATLLGACLLYAPQDQASAGANFIASLLSFANIKLMLQGNYFEMSPDAQPFLHFWSLSVEEQFYLVFPLALAFFYSKSKQLAFSVGLVVALVSFALCVWLTPIRQAWAFYLLPTRAWELLCGALICRSAVDSPEMSWRMPSNAMSWAGLIGVAASIYGLREGAGFPGYVAALPVLATTGLLWSIDRPGGSAGATGFLRHPALVAIGKLSYSLYLWHWPVFSFVDYSLFLWPEPARATLKIVISILLAVASYLLVESPARRFLSLSQRAAPAFAAIALSLVAGVCVGAYLHLENYLDASPRDIAQGGIVANARGANGPVVLIGDSTGSMYGTVLRDACVATDRRLSVLSDAGGWPFPDRIDGDGREWSDVLSVIYKTRPELIVVACRWESMARRSPELPRRVVRQLLEHGDRVALVNSVPFLPENASREGMRKGSRPPFFEPSGKKPDREGANALIAELADDRVVVVDASKFFVNEKQEILCLDARGRCLYHDSGHLSGFGAAELFGEFVSLLTTSRGGRFPSK